MEERRTGSENCLQRTGEAALEKTTGRQTPTEEIIEKLFSNLSEDHRFDNSLIADLKTLARSGKLSSLKEINSILTSRKSGGS